MNRSARRTSDEGVTTVEFALVLPLFVFLIGVATYFGWMFFQQTQLDRAANRAARYAAVLQTDGRTGFCSDLVLASINADLAASSVTTVTVSDGRGNIAGPSTGGVCTAVPLGYVKVSITHNVKNPFAAVLTVFTSGNDDLVLSGSGQVRVEHS